MLALSIPPKGVHAPSGLTVQGTCSLPESLQELLGMGLVHMKKVQVVKITANLMEE
jgi:hypothetical protein